MEFELNGKEFIELNKLLKILGLVESGGQANLFITEGQVTVDGEVETAKRKKMRTGAVIHFMENEITVK
jgi:ribosome-associated protein